MDCCWIRIWYLFRDAFDFPNKEEIIEEKTYDIYGFKTFVHKNNSKPGANIYDQCKS